MAKSKIQKGNDLMVFVEGKSIAFATSHQLSLSLETETVQTKDSGYDGAELPKNVSWEITSDNLYIDGEYDNLVKMMLTRKPVKVVWGHAVSASVSGSTITANENYTPEFGFTDEIKGTMSSEPETNDSSIAWTVDKKVTYYMGTAYVTSLTASASAGDNSTFSLTLKGSGSIAPYQNDAAVTVSED